MKKTFLFIAIIGIIITLCNNALHAQQSKDNLNVIVAGTKDGSISKDSLIKHPLITCSAKELEVKSFTMTYRQGTNLIKKTSKGNKLTRDMLKAISKMTPGTNVYFENINALGNPKTDSAAKMLPSIRLIVK
jgi:hypothetical protein